MFIDNKNKRGHAIALFSGGLDSSLAILMIQKQGIEVTALTFLTHFSCDISDKSSCCGDPNTIAEKFGFTVKSIHLGEKFNDIVKSPKYGYGKNMNPCIDCRILMLREAKRFMEFINADFIFTGEVLGQRPMSQLRNSLNIVSRDSELKDILVRPLSAKLLPETTPEKNGLLNRELLAGISGRSRKTQLAMAEEWGLEDYSAPAGGCLLTDPQYSKRLRDLIDHNPDFNVNDINLLRVGRHFRLDENSRLIVGRNEKENGMIVEYAQPDDIILEAIGTGSPIGLYIHRNNEKHLKLAAAITARYCDLKKEPIVEITYIYENDGRRISVTPANPQEVPQYQIK